VRTNSITAWLGHHAWPLWLLLAAAVLCVVLLQLSAWSRERRLRRKRAGVTQETFTAQLQQYGFDPVITSATFRYLREVQLVPFPVLPGDDLEKDLGLSPEDVDESVRDLSVATDSAGYCGGSDTAASGVAANAANSGRRPEDRGGVKPR